MLARTARPEVVRRVGALGSLICVKVPGAAPEVLRIFDVGGIVGKGVPPAGSDAVEVRPSCETLGVKMAVRYQTLLMTPEADQTRDSNAKNLCRLKESKSELEVNASVRLAATPASTSTFVTSATELPTGTSLLLARPFDLKVTCSRANNNHFDAYKTHI